MIHDWLFTPTKGDGSGPLRAGPHYGNEKAGNEGAWEKAEREREYSTAENRRLRK